MVAARLITILWSPFSEDAASIGDGASDGGGGVGVVAQSSMENALNASAISMVPVTTSQSRQYIGESVQYVRG